MSRLLLSTTGPYYSSQSSYLSRQKDIFVFNIRAVAIEGVVLDVGTNMNGALRRLSQPLAQRILGQKGVPTQSRAFAAGEIPLSRPIDLLLGADHFCLEPKAFKPYRQYLEPWLVLPCLFNRTSMRQCTSTSSKGCWKSAQAHLIW
jgi:hypothetical protein